MLQGKLVAALVGLSVGCGLAGTAQAEQLADQASAKPAAASETSAKKAQPVRLTKRKTVAKTKVVAAAPADTGEAAPVVTKSESPALISNDGKFTFGGAIRARFDSRFNKKATGFKTNHFSFDTLALKAKYDSSTFFASGQYRIYGGSFIYGKKNGYERYPGEVHFPMQAYVGYKFTPEDSVLGGINQAPFGLTPYFGSSFLESMGFTAGIEEVYNLGVKYSHADANWTWDLAYYPTMAPEGEGISKEAARYSTNMVKADTYVPFGSNNHERHMVVGRIEHTFLKNDVASFKAGVSGWFSQVHNLDTNKNGHKAMEAVHFDATYGNWGFKGIYVRQDIKAKNPGRDDMITIGGYDGSYNIAAKGNLFSGEVNYKVPNMPGPFELMPYLNYSTFIKDKSGFKTSERYILGGAWTFKKDPRLVIYSEGVLGKNDPYVGAGQYTGGLAQGGDNKWKKSIIVNIGFYF